MLKPEFIATAPETRAGWRGAVSTLRWQPAHSRVLGGSIIMLLGSGMVSVFNFAYNVAVARMLGPSSFGHAAAAVTLLMLVSAITLAFQLVCAKLVARNEYSEVRAAVYQRILRRSWKVGLVLGTGLMIAAGPVSRYLNLPTSNIVVVLALGIAFYVPLGAKRGGLQGCCSFRRLSLNFVLEAVTKFFGALILVKLGYGVLGAVAAISLSVLLAYLIPPVPEELKIKGGSLPSTSFREGMQAITFFVGQVIISNADIILVKHFFEAEKAGVYAAIALVGRLIYYASWSVVSAMFPVSASSQNEEEHKTVLIVPIAIVLGISLFCIIALSLFPSQILHAVFGQGFQITASTSSLFSLYPAVSGIYSLAVALMAYEMSRKIANTAWIQFAMSLAIVVGISLFHSTLHEVVVVQLALMVLLLFIVSAPFFRRRRKVSVLEEVA